ncbi:hypothetical protein AAFN60_18925 [Roseibacillus persicicus]|uniref:hypothetical protein n=1 Tax=Roseibacillus persicicus TaxID=454148 RepID=UPI00398A9C3A
MKQLVSRRKLFNPLASSLFVSRSKLALALILAIVSPVFGQTLQEDEEINDAEIVGEVSDGRPAPPPEPAELPDFKIRRAKFHQLSEHRMIFHQVEKPDLPQAKMVKPQMSEEEIEAFFDSEEFLKMQKEAAESPLEFAAVSATVYDGEKTYLRWWHEGQSFEAWSNLDFNHLSGFHEFKGRGKRFAFFMGLGNVDTKNSKLEISHPQGPRLPELSERGPAYFLLEGDETNEDALIFMDVLHDLYEKDSDRLKKAHEERVKNRQIREEELRKNPPKKENAKFYFWKKGEK